MHSTGRLLLPLLLVLLLVLLLPPARSPQQPGLVLVLITLQCCTLILLPQDLREDTTDASVPAHKMEGGDGRIINSSTDHNKHWTVSAGQSSLQFFRSVCGLLTSGNPIVL
jgi:hypothetical protein